ncbi:Redoxin [Camillea tinctor]|nr:Redoxin [Camillea tinctor]
MALRAFTRRIPTTTTSASSSLSSRISTSARHFHATPRAAVKVGDAIPDIEALQEDSPAKKVSLAREFASGIPDGVVVGVPGAFSPGCSQKHIPSYINHPKLGDAGQVFVVSINDAFVMKAWGDQLDPTKASGIRFLADPSGVFTKALELDFDASAFFGNERSKRYALVVKDGKVKSVHVEPDSTGTDVSMAEKVLS